MKSAEITKNSSQEFFHKICVVGGGLTGAIMSLLLKNSNLFKSHEIGWIKPKIANSNDIRTTFYNKKSLELLESLDLLKNLSKKDYTFINKIQVFGMNNSSPLEWDYSGSKLNFGAVIKNNIILKSVTKQLNDIKQYDFWHSFYQYPNKNYLQNYRISFRHEQTYDHSETLKRSSSQFPP